MLLLFEFRVTMEGREERRNREEVKLSDVKLKVVGVNLEVIRDYQEKLVLVSACADKSCKISLYEGKASAFLFM